MSKWDTIKYVIKYLFSIGGLINWRLVLVFYLVFGGLIYAINAIIIGNFFILNEQIDFLKKLWFLPVLHLEMSLITYFLLDKMAKPHKKFFLKRKITNSLILVLNALANKVKPFRFKYGRLLIFLSIYTFFTYSFFNLIDKLNTQELWKNVFGILIILTFKIVILYKIIQLLTITKIGKRKYASIILPFALTEFLIILIRFLLERKEIYRHVKESISLMFQGTSIPLVFGFSLTIPILLYFLQKQKFVEEYEDVNLLRDIFSTLALAFLFTIMFILLLSEPFKGIQLRYSQIQTIYIFKEFYIFSSIIILFVRLLYQMGNISKEIENLSKNSQIKKFEGEVIGNSTYSYKHLSFGRYSVDKIVKFKLIKTSKGTINVLVPNINSMLYDQKFSLINGDNVEIFGIETTNKNVSDDKEYSIRHVFPLYINIKRSSFLRDIS